MKLLLIYLIIINVVTFITYGRDKNLAIRKKWRIPEATLLGMALIGGSAGAYIGMRIFHHKTRKPAFRYGVPLMLIVQILILVGTEILWN